MKKVEHRPKMMVKMRLSLAWQNKLLSLLHQHFGISESYTEDHLMYVPSHQFVMFLFAMQKAGFSVTLKQLNAEYVDIKKEPQITVVRPYVGNYARYEKHAGETEGALAPMAHGGSAESRVRYSPDDRPGR